MQHSRHATAPSSLCQFSKERTSSLAGVILHPKCSTAVQAQTRYMMLRATSFRHELP